MSTNLAAGLTNAADDHRDRPALAFNGEHVSYAKLNGAAARVGTLLRDRGIGPGDRVGIMLPNVPEFASAYYGVLRLGAVVVPMNVLLKEREVAFYLGDSGAKLILAWHEFSEHARSGATLAAAQCVLVSPGQFEPPSATVEPADVVAERRGDDTAVILYTSGTTGKPKGAELTHTSLARNAEIAVGLFGLHHESVVLGALPLFHAFGQTCGLNAAIRAGGCLTLIPRFDPGKVLEVIDAEQVTVFEGVPTMYSALLHHPGRDAFDTSSLTCCASGGAALPVEVLHSFEHAFGCSVMEGYGLSETSPIASFNPPDRERKPGSIGLPVEGVQMRVVDDQREPVAAGEIGEIAIRGHNVMRGYWNRPDATAEAIDADGWFYSGDMARVDEEGYYFIVDRKKDLIIRGGYNVYPREIEEVLYEHAAVREVAVIGVPHVELGEEVAAAVVLRPGTEASVDQLREYVKSQVAAYKYPRHLWLVDELPKGPTGKILKREIIAPAELASVGA